MYNLLGEIIYCKNLKNKIEYIRSGGQTGMDEAGAKASLMLGIPTLIYAPKNWLFKDINGITYSDEVLFKKDFIMSWCPNCKDLVDTYKEWYQDEEGDIITEYFCEECGYNISHYEDKLKRNGK